MCVCVRARARTLYLASSHSVCGCASDNFVTECFGFECLSIWMFAVFVWWCSFFFFIYCCLVFGLHPVSVSLIAIIHVYIHQTKNQIKSLTQHQLQMYHEKFCTKQWRSHRVSSCNLAHRKDSTTRLLLTVTVTFFRVWDFLEWEIRIVGNAYWQMVLESGWGVWVLEGKLTQIPWLILDYGCIYRLRSNLI